jgi:hypothetical protein
MTTIWLVALNKPSPAKGSRYREDLQEVAKRVTKSV